MLIGELAEKTGLSRDTIRYYEKRGILKKCEQRRNNNYKEYTDDAVSRLKLVKIGKELGFSLEETCEFLYYWENNRTDDARLNEMVREKIGQVEEKIRQLTLFKKNLEAALVSCEPGG